MSTEPITALLDMLRRSGAPAKPVIHYEPDPPNQNSRLYYRIVGATREAVQSAVTDLENKVGDGSGYAVFEAPRPCEGGYIAQGAVVVFEASVTL